MRTSECGPFPIKRVLAAALAGLVVLLLLLALAAVLTERETLPEDGLRLYAWAAALAGFLCAGFLAARRGRLPAAALSGALLLAALLVLGGALLPGPFDSAGLPPLCALAAAGAVGGAFLSGLLR